MYYVLLVSFNLEAPHNVTIVLSTMVASFNGTVYLSCDSDGGPNNTFEWIKDAVILGNDKVLVIANVDAFSGGDYICTVNNAAGGDNAFITLNVAPYIATPLDEQVLTTVGSSLSISCDAAGFPPPTVQWTDTNDVMVSNSSLQAFDPVMFGAEGLYRCVASAEIDGMNFNASDETTLIGRPTFIVE